ncbi:penicillin acylase family protein [Peribacillus simplex]|uniref:Penicillin acylase family protein n=2 Tax=Peribacillus TaxID=2675229 RepID=A0AA90PAP2_9BACI|nr:MULTISPECIES: penicillin acylase family protein [Peribacillus]MDP1417092.1 penicillin acylase family protein [Peribacillus simplex]MDP1449747.1 penicillin acylase family protein [Peribacillus frigoritolerans]
MPVGGSSVTVQAAAFLDDGTVNHGGSWRFVIDLADMNQGYHLVGPGQSLKVSGTMISLMIGQKVLITKPQWTIQKVVS